MHEVLAAAARSICVSCCLRCVRRGKRKMPSSSRCRHGCQLPVRRQTTLSRKRPSLSRRRMNPQINVWAMSVDIGHRIFHQRGVMVSEKSGGHSKRVNRKLRRDCLGNPSKLSMEVLKRTVNPQRPGQEWPPLCRRCCAAIWDGGGGNLSATLATLCHARSRMALWECGEVEDVVGRAE